ncbi:hypothetical protein RB195_003307 [Necator americanus]|uniref:Elongation of very long chain fatty acids protein n=1 Tax=Necator americanus TaxID=51031 RepID=A0ABR1DMY1_NECAM
MALSTKFSYETPSNYLIYASGKDNVGKLIPCSLAKAAHICLFLRAWHVVRCLVVFLLSLRSLSLSVCLRKNRLVGTMEHPLVQRLTDVKFDTRRFLSLVTHGGKNFPDKEGRKWVADHFDITIQLSILYVVVVFGLRHIMRKREPFSLFVPLNIWNFTLAVFSIIGTIKLTPEFWNTLFDKGLQNSYCYAYDFTKDTVFIVLRKRPLMFLHWYHHILTAVYAFYSHPHTPGFNRYGIYLNFTVHAFMYSYYFLRSMKISLPGLGTIAKFITTLQIFQFVVSCAILVHIGYLVNIAGIPCDFDSNIFVLAILTYCVAAKTNISLCQQIRRRKDKITNGIFIVLSILWRLSEDLTMSYHSHHITSNVVLQVAMLTLIRSF